MNTFRLTLGIFFGAAIGALAANPEFPVIPAIAPPKIDGMLDEPDWQAAAKIGQLYLENTDTPVSDTVVLLARDSKWLYLGFQCANSNMAHVIQTVFKHDDIYPNFYANESVEVYLQPEKAQDRYYWFVLTADNVAMEQRIQTTPVRKQDVGWNTFWRSAARRLPRGWTAEVAIPLQALECDDLVSVHINIARNLRAIELDPMGAKQNERTVYSTLKAGTPGRGKSHDLNNFCAVSGLGGFKPEAPFAPQIAAAEIVGWRRQAGQFFYDVKVTLQRFTGVAGQVKVQVLEDFGAGGVEKAFSIIDLDGKTGQRAGAERYQRDLILSVAAEDLRERQVRVALTDAADGSLLAAMAIADLSALNVIKQAFVGRSYYTIEENAEIRLEIGLPPTMLPEAVLALEVNGAAIPQIKGLQPVMTPGLPLNALQLGDNTVIARLIAAGQELAAKTLTVKRLDPRPGFEVKCDFINGAILKDGRPIFPVGIYNNVKIYDENLFKFLKDAGFTTLVNEHITKDPGAAPLANAQAERFAKLADKYGLDVIEWIVSATPWAGYKPGDSQPRLMQPLAERLAYQREGYVKLAPMLAENAKILRERRNMLCYYNVDEPNLGDRDANIAVAEWYWNTAKAIDPYRPLFLLYSMNIPHGGNWTRWGEILGFDIYPRPFTGRIYSEPGLYTAYYAYILRERCRQDNKIMFFVPLANKLDIYRTPIGMSKAHMLCQAYTAVIYGARGLFYFALDCVVGADAWDALRTINAQIREMSPALLNGEVAQQIRYAPDNFIPAEQKFPMVNAAVFQYPDGDYLLLAANIAAHAVETEFGIGGLQAAARMFGAGESTEISHKGTKPQSAMKLDKEKFKDKIEGYGVRAYRLQLPPRPTEGAAGLPAPVAVAVSMTAMPGEPAPRVDVVGIYRRAMHGKNHVPNPCFKQQHNQGVPDFYLPNWSEGLDPERGKPGSSWYLDAQTPWNGSPSLCMVYSKPELSGGICGICYPPDAPNDQPRKMVFSFYGKGAKHGDTAIVQLPFAGKGRYTRFPLTVEWQRYQAAGELKPYSPDWTDFNGRPIYWIFMRPAPPSGSRIWVSGLQMEAGETATGFQDD